MDSDPVNGIGTLEFFKSLQTAKYVHASMFLLQYYDYLISFNAEVQFIWSQRWSISKAFFLLVRYPALVTVWFPFVLTFLRGSVKLCSVMLRMEIAFTAETYLIVVAILLVRLLAIYRGIVTPYRIFIYSYLTMVIACWVLFGIWNKKIQAFPVPNNLAPGCYHLGSRTLNMTSYGILAAWEFAMCVALVYKGWLDHRTQRVPFIKMMRCLGCQFYNPLFAVSLINFIYIVNGPSNPQADVIVSAIQRTLHAILASRLLIHARRLYVRQQQRHHPPTATADSSSPSSLSYAMTLTSRSRDGSDVEAGGEVVSPGIEFNSIATLSVGGDGRLSTVHEMEEEDMEDDDEGESKECQCSSCGEHDNRQ